MSANKKEPVLSKNAPQPIGPYSQAIRSGSLLFCSGQIALDAVTGQVSGTTVEAQIQKLMENLGAVLQAGGATFDDVVKTTIFLKSMNDFPKVNEIYAKFFPGIPPARSTVEVSRLPKDVLVEVEAVAVL